VNKQKCLQAFLSENNNICVAWSQLDTLQALPKLTSDFLHTCTSLETGALMKKTLAVSRKISLKSSDCGHTPFEESTTKYAIVAANNHYAGFGPATANSFRKMLGLKEAVWEEMKQKRL
jgi:hypothetical protein